MSNILDSIKYHKQLQEFGQYARIILPVMKDPEITREKKRETLNSLVNNLTYQTFKTEIIAEQIIEIIDVGQHSDNICKEYDNTDKQVMGVLSWCPRMDYYKDMLYKVIRANRRKYGLNL